MKTGKRLLALLLVLAMMLSNLPMGAIAAEFEELTAEPTEALTETEQPIEEAPAETEAPETTEAATTEAVTEAAEETTEAATEEATEAATEEATEAATEEATEAATEEATEAATEEATEPAEVEELTASEEAALETAMAGALIFRWLDTEYDESGNALYYEPEGTDVSNLDMLPTAPFYVAFYAKEWDENAAEWLYTPVEPADLVYDHDEMTISAIPADHLLDGGDYGHLAVVTPKGVWDSEDKTITYTTEDNAILSMDCWLGRSPNELYYTNSYNNDTVITNYTIDPDAENVFYYYFDTTRGWEQQSFTQTLGAEYVDVEYLDGQREIKYTFTDEAVAEAAAGNWLHLEFEAAVYHEADDVYTTWTTPFWVGVKETEEAATPSEEGLYFRFLEDWGEGAFDPHNGDCYGTNIGKFDEYSMYFFLNIWDEEQGCYVEIPVHPEHDAGIILNQIENVKDGGENGGYYYYVSIADDALDTEQQVWVEYEGVTYTMPITSNLHNVAVYTTEGPSHDTRVMAPVDVDPSGENVLYIATNDDWTITNVNVDDGVAGYVELKELNSAVWSVTLTEAGIDQTMEQWILDIGMNVDIQNVEDPNWTENRWLNAPFSRADSGDVTPSEEGFYFRFLEDWGEGAFDPHNGDCFGTNIGKFDEYSMYFFLNIWDEEQGCYVEIPVNPEHDAGIILNRIENVRGGEENGEYYYAVSIADDALDTDQEVWVEYEGVTYTMPITSGLHGVAVYTTQEPSHDTRVMAPVDVEPFGENVLYLATNGDWTITDVFVDDWASEYVELEELSETVWSVTLTEAGINRNMSQWILDIGMNVDIQNVEDPNWTENHWRNVAFSRENLESKGWFQIDGEDWAILDGGYIHSWPTGEYDEWDNEIWDSEVLTDLPKGLTYDWTTNTLAMENYSGEWMRFEYECYDWENDFTFYNMPSDTLTIELSGDNTLATENAHAFIAEGGLNVVFTGDGELTVETINDYAFEGDYARVYNTMELHGGYLTIQDNASVTVEIAGEGNESCWDGDTYLGDRAGNMTALSMDHGQLYIKDNARLETVIPEGAQRNGSEDVGEENAIWDERFPGGYRGIADTFLLKVMGGTLVTQSLDFGSGYHEDGTFWTNNYAQTGGEVIIQATGWNNILEEDGVTQHTHYEGFTVRPGATAGIWGGSLTVNVEATDAQLASSTYYEGIAIHGGELEIGGDAEVTVEANHESGNLVGVYCEDGTGRLSITGGTLNVNGTSGEGNGRAGIYLDHETVFTMSGGTINSWYADFMNHGPAHISGGTINIGGLYFYDTMFDSNDIPYAWITGFYAGGPEFTIDGGEINIDGGHFVASGMVAMNGGTMNINKGCLEVSVSTAFAFNDGEINITNPVSEISEYEGREAFSGSALTVEAYFSIGGSDIENAAPTLNISDHQINSVPVVIAGTYHQMAGSTVNLTYGGTENPGIHVVSEFETDVGGGEFPDEKGEPVVLSHGTFLMNDGVLNVINPGDENADLSRAMQVDYASFAQFRGGETNFDTARLFWNGEVHITENAVVEVKDTAIFANAGHLVMDDGLLLANEESAVCLGNAEMNGGRMELDNAMILVNSGFLFNNGEIVINNTDETINTEAVFTSLAANTYFAIGDPEDPNSNPKLTINHSTSTPAVMVNGTMHLMAGSVEINASSGAPVVWVCAQYDEDEHMLDEEGNPIAGSFLQNGGHLVINNVNEDGGTMGGIVTEPYGVFFMNGGTADLNGANLVLTGESFLYDKAVLNVNEGTVELCDVGYTGASLEIDGEAQLNVQINGTEQQYDENGDWIWNFGVYASEGTEILVNGGTVSVDAVDINGAFVTWGEFTQTGGIMNLSVIDESGTYEGENAIETNGPTNITGGVMNLVSTDTGFANNSAEELEDGSRVNISGGTINIEVPRLAMFLCSSTDISGGDINIGLSNYYYDMTDENGAFIGYERYAQGIFAYGWDNPDMTLNITGGKINIVVEDADRECANTYVNAVLVGTATANITGGEIRANGGIVNFYSFNADDYLNLGDMVVYSLDSGRHLRQLSGSEEYPGGTQYFSSFSEDDDLNGTLADNLIIVTGKAGTNTTWEVNDGVLTFQSTENIGGMYDYSATAPAPWYWLHDFITIVEMDTHLGYIGSYAFNGLDKLTKLVFLGEAPNFAENAFAVIDTDAFYPVETDSWTTGKMQDYGGNIAWILNFESVEVIDILTDKDVLFSGEKTTLTANMYPELEKKSDVVWTLAEGDADFATLTVKNNVATVTAKTVTEKQVITLYAVAKNGMAQPVARTLTIYPKAQSVSIFAGEEDVTGGKIKHDLVSSDELKLTAALNPGDAEEYLTPAVEWTSSSAKVATVDENGVVTFLGAGTVKITATATDGSKKKATVSITALEMIQDIEMAEGSVEELLGGKSASFTAVDADTRAKLKSSQVTWSMDEEFAPYASITAAGKLTTKVVQEAVQVTIQATLVDNEAVYEVHTVTIRPATTLLQLENGGQNVTGDTIYVDTDGYDADGLPVVVLSAVAYPDGTFADVTWKSSSTAIAKVEDGIVTGVWDAKKGACKTGTVTITATSTDGSKKTASVKLNFGIFAQDVEITSTEKEIVSGQSLTLTAETFPKNPTKAGVTWSLKNASDKDYLSITAAGKAKAKTVYAPTDVELVATSKDGRAYAEMTLTVLPKDDSILVIKSGEDYVTKTTQTLDLNGDASITLSAFTLNGDQETVTWTPATSKLGTLTKNEDGTLTVTMTKAGSMTVTAKAADGRKATVTLKAVALATGVTIKEKATGASADLTLAAGKTLTLVPTITGAAKAAVIWSVEPSGIATITSSGKLTASAGLAYAQPVTVTATANDGSGTYGELEIMLKPQVQGIQIHGLTGELTNCTVTCDMAEDAVLQLSAETFPADAASGVTWKSSSDKVATIDENGRITCVKPGTVTITATATDGSGKKATFKLKVVKQVTELVMEKTAVLAGGKSLTLKADAGDATDGSVTWSMTGDTAYATLSAKGVLKASAVTAPKTVYVTATANDGSGETATCVVTIYPATTSVQVLRDGETVTGKTIEVQAGQTITLEGSSLPVSAAGLYTWKSSGTAAEVTEDGEVTGVTAGKTVTITCTAADGSGKKATVKIKVVPAV